MNYNFKSIRRQELYKPIGLILFSVVMGVLGQYFFKAGMNQPAYKMVLSRISGGISEAKESLSAENAGGKIKGVFKGIFNAVASIITLFLKPFVLIGLTCYVISTVSWLAILSKVDLSYAYPLISLGYLIILFVGSVFFKEQITVWRIIGVLLISCGIYFINVGPPVSR